MKAIAMAGLPRNGGSKSTWLLPLIAMIAMAPPARGQSPFSTGKVDGSIVVKEGGFVQADLNKELFKVGYEVYRADQYAAMVRKTRPHDEVRWGPRFGFEIAAIPSGNVATFFRNRNVTAGGRLAVSFGLSNVVSSQPSADTVEGSPAWTPRCLSDDRVTLSVSTSRERATFYDAARPYAEQFFRRTFQGYAVRLAYAAEFVGRLPSVLGLALGWERSTNLGELGVMEVKDQRTTYSADSTVVRTITTTRKGLVGPAEERTRTTLAVDWVVYPGLVGLTGLVKPRASVALDVFARATGAGKEWKPGVGAYVTVPGAPLKVYGGVALYRDREGHVASDIVAGYPF